MTKKELVDEIYNWCRDNFTQLTNFAEPLVVHLYHDENGKPLPLDQCVANFAAYSGAFKNKISRLTKLEK